ncbi:MAG TPA: hypothetical protein VFQ44_10260 [Streptosporangiaceae bacterium]|nr:hypothetical protein [Streptosporangiaceae bacterium]
MDGMSAPVAGPSVIFPRGYLWFGPFWCAVATGALAVSRWPLWLKADAAGGLLIAMVIFVSAVASLTFRAFSVDRGGVRLGLPSSTRRRGRRRRAAKHIPWQQIERVRIARRPHGVRVELVLGQNATLAVRGYQPSSAAIALQRILLLIPFAYLAMPTGLTTPLDGPPRFRVVIRDITVDEMRRALRALAPPEVAIAVLVRRRTSVSSAKAAGVRQPAQ